MKCRSCDTPLKHLFLDLGFAPLSNAYLTEEDLSKPEMYYPLRVFVCHECWLVQTQDFTDVREIFSPNYAYFSSTSSSWLNHAAEYCQMIIKKLNLNKNSQVIEIACNDGYLLRNFVNKGIPNLGIEPALDAASVAEGMGVKVIKDFLNLKLAIELSEVGVKADLIIGNNVFAHVPDINEFTKSMKLLLKDNGTITLEFPHLMRLIKMKQFDTVYHEHFSYLSLHAVKTIFENSDLKIWYVEEIETHGGSLRVYVCHEAFEQEIDSSVSNLLTNEIEFGIKNIETYLNFQLDANKIKNDFLGFLLTAQAENRTVAAYGAAAKGNTLLNFAGIKTDLIHCVYDAALSKQGKFLPGSHIPILPPNKMLESKIDYLVVLPWNILDEIAMQNHLIRDTGTKFVIAIPKLHLI